MMTFLIYLLNVSASVVVLFALYYVTLRHYTFHQANRACLLTIVVFSFIVPIVPVATEFNHAIAIADKVKASYYSGPVPDTIGIPMDITADPGDAFPYAVVIYILGCTFFVCRFVKSLLSLWRLRRSSGVEEFDGIRIRRAETDSSFTFLSTIFIPYNENDNIIIHHEYAHASQRHWVDLMLIELTSIVLWFNPFVFLLKRELRLQHEYLADKSVMEHGISFEDYAHCLMRKIQPSATIYPTSPLHSNSTKKRILMMTRSRSPRYVLIAYLLLVPACAILLMSFGQRRTRTAVATVTDSVPLPETVQDQQMAPVDLTKVTKIVVYGDRIHPATQKLTKHTGVDFALPSGSDVRATGDGVVAIQQYGEKEGNYIVIKHHEGHMTRYYHLEKALVKKGEAIKKGQLIGLVGSTGVYSQGSHLHYEVIQNGTAVDPKDYLPSLPDL